MTAARRWLRAEHAQLATDRILDAAAQAFAEQGVAATRMDDVARLARCSRGTLYRYFDSREQLHLAYIHREAARIHGQLRQRLDEAQCPGDAIIDGMTHALAEVRNNPTLSAWFAADAQGTTNLLAGSSVPLFEMAVGFLNSLLEPASHAGRLRTDVDRRDAAEWLMRAMFSMLSVTGPAARTPEQETRYLRQFVLPAVLSD